ncbi:MAG: hypothetical protein OXF11_06925 [Deltaproteobacteria bacterium]|nr:hypothetical protein [Deltaproteobacteria bacterium]
MKKGTKSAMRVDEIRVEEVDKEYFVWLDDKILVLTAQQAQIMIDQINAAIRERWKPKRS